MEAYVFDRKVTPLHLSDTFEIVPQQKGSGIFAWLKWLFYRKVLSPLMHSYLKPHIRHETAFVRTTINCRTIEELVGRQSQNIMSIWHDEVALVVLGREEFYQASKEYIDSPIGPFNVNFHMHRGGMGMLVRGVPTIHIPWFEGVLLIPKKQLKDIV